MLSINNSNCVLLTINEQLLYNFNVNCSCTCHITWYVSVSSRAPTFKNQTTVITTGAIKCKLYKGPIIKWNSFKFVSYLSNEINYTIRFIVKLILIFLFLQTSILILFSLCLNMKLFLDLSEAYQAYPGQSKTPLRSPLKSRYLIFNNNLDCR